MWTKKEISGFVDLTSLNSFDSVPQIENFIKQALEYERQGFPVAAVCLYPNFSSLAVQLLKDSAIKTAVVAGNFPSSQGYMTTKLMECEMSILAGVDEIDIVLNLGAFDANNYNHVVEEVKAFKGLMPNKTLKVILETGYLKTPERIRKASELAIQGGADFIKTSTGKEFPGASLEAVEIMAKVVAASKSKENVGIKISGGVRTYEDALAYFKLIKSHLGVNYITPNKLRIGASSLVKNLVDD